MPPPVTAHCLKCRRTAKGYRHDENGCGLVNKIRLKVPHTHFYCPACGHEWTEESSQGELCV